MRESWRLLAVLVAFAMRLMLIALRGDYLVYDEGYYLLLARSLRAGHGFTLNGLPHVSLSPLQPLAVAALSAAGLPDLWASRLLAAACGALLVLPVASLAARWFPARGVVAAAALATVFPPLVAFLPFFPGERWNLYFGSEPLYLLLGLSAIAVAAQAVETGRRRDWLAAGALAALAYCARLEGIVLAAALAVSAGLALAITRRARRMPGVATAIAAGTLVALPYLAYLHRELGRWALSGRVQAAALEEAPPRAAPTAAPPPAGPSEIVRGFVWGGDRQALWHTLYGLDPSGTRMASQYWGVARSRTVAQATNPAAPAPSTRLPAEHPTHAAAPPPPPTPPPAPPAPPPPPGRLRTLLLALGIAVPWWVAPIAAWGAVRASPRRDLAVWLAPVLAATIVPALLAYAEPRALLLLAPAACILAGGAAADVGAALARRTGAGAARVLAPAALVGAVLVPTVRDAARSWNDDTPLQQLASARRAVGEYLGRHLPPDARIVSWHPAIAIYAHRDWRVLPYDTLPRILRYAQAQQAAIVVLSRFEPSPLRNPPRPFTAILVDSGAPPGDTLRLDRVDETPLLFVGRLARRP